MQAGEQKELTPTYGSNASVMSCWRLRVVARRTPIDPGSCCERSGVSMPGAERIALLPVSAYRANTAD